MTEFGRGGALGPGDLRRMPVFRELLEQWRVNRAALQEISRRAFSRDWERLLIDAGIASAEERSEALRDAEVLEAAGLAKLTRPRARPYQIERIAVLPAAEARLREWFAGEWSVQEKRDLATIEWAPELAFVLEARLGVAVEDLLKLNEFFLRGGHRDQPMPVKERSLQIFGDEKRLDALRATALFREGRLNLERHLCAFVVAEPLGWRRGPSGSCGSPMLVIENASTFDSYCVWNERVCRFSAIAYGGGNRFPESVSRLADIFAEIGGARPVFYFGDIDAPGIRIARRADDYTRQLGMGPIWPELRSYRWLLDYGTPAMADEEGRDLPTEADLLWLGKLAEPILPLLKSGRRLAQENIHRTFLLASGG